MSRDRPIMDFLRKYRIVRRVAAVGGILAGVYLIGSKLGWW